jgi:arginyl-tRNA synthetase
MPEFARLTLVSIQALGKNYGHVKAEKTSTVIVEHTSANPVHPIHIGTARNPVLGDSLTRILRARGHDVRTHYYVDDVGRQTSVIAYGYQRLREPKPETKPDHFIGTIYAIASCIVEIQKLKKTIERAKKQEDPNELSKLNRELDEWTAAATELETNHPQLFTQLLEEMSKDSNPEVTIAELNLNYERGEDEAKKLIRKVSELCLEGFRQTLGRMNIAFDSWDWESDFVWKSYVGDVVKKLAKTSYVTRTGGVLEFDADKAAKDLGLKSQLGIREEYELMPLTLVRADGTTLYTTRDIAYNLWKFKEAEEVVNVIGMEQTLAQIQLKIALCALGHLDEARKLRHFAYNLVRLPGHKMSGRAGRYITLDETMDEAVKRAYDEVEKRSPNLTGDEKRQISEEVGIGAMKFALIQVDPTKPVVFTWDRVLDFEKNSAPYIQYSHARAGSILRKAERQNDAKTQDYSLLSEQIERAIILCLGKFPDACIGSSENLRPNQIADYAISLADKFNTFYSALPVLKAKPHELMEARLILVASAQTVLHNALGLLGITAPEKM